MIRTTLYCVCDRCGDEIGPYDDIDELREGKKEEGWVSRKDKNEEWYDCCEECK